MSIKWRFTLLFLSMTAISLFLVWEGQNLIAGGQQRTPDYRLLLFALLLPGGAVFFYARRLAGRIQTLSFTTRRIAQGDFERAQFLDTKDEVGQFTAELNRLARQLETLIQKADQETHKMQAILTAMQEGVIALDHVGRIVRVNPAAEKMFGHRQDEVMLKYLLELVRQSELDELVTNVLLGETPGNIELTLEQRTMRFQVSPILGENKRTRGAVIVTYDITELRRLEQMRTEFVGNVSHELRTPLTSIKGFVETLLDGAQEEPVLRERFLNVIQAETLRLQRLIDDLLTLANNENPDLRRGAGVARVSFVQQAFAKIQPVIESYAEAKGIRLSVDLAENLPAVRMGEDLLSQVLLNLLENAVKYTSEGKIWLKGEADQERVHLEFGDTGCGIPTASLPRIFERFYRVDKARSREQGGTGLGLSIVKHIVEGSDGRINVSSEPGIGTVFTCDLPRA
ncbi:MAG: two-component system histidine kinase PnpS [Desulfitobacteriaceae bacterium]